MEARETSALAGAACRSWEARPPPPGELLIAPLKDSERRDLLEVLEDRYDHRSTVVTSQVPTKTWHEMLADSTVADAICDRLVHNAHVLSLKGPSMRKKKGLGEKNTEE